MQAVLVFFGHIFASIAVFAQAAFPLPAPQARILTTTAVSTSTRPTSIALRPASFPAAASKPVKTATSTPTTSKVVATVIKNPAPTPVVPLSQPAPPLLPADVVNQEARAALVNILCITKGGGSLDPISGSGMIITDNGVILTNAHVAQYFLLRDYLVPNNVTCTIRTGSPATAKYKAELLYLPPAWINANADQIIAQQGMGTGENDYAFLRITSPIDPSAPLPDKFPSLAVTLDEPLQGQPMLLAGYPAGFLEGIIIQMNLYSSAALITIGHVYSFNDEGSADLISLGGSVVAQEGSSGGGVVRQQDASLQGIIATESEGKTTSSRDLRAITLSHINRSLYNEGQGGLVKLVSGDIQAKATAFQTTIAPLERQRLANVLDKK